MTDREYGGVYRWRDERTGEPMYVVLEEDVTDPEREKLVEEMCLAYDRRRQNDLNRTLSHHAIDGYMSAALAVAEAAIRADEREACAKVAEKHANLGLLTITLSSIAAAIRARGGDDAD